MKKLIVITFALSVFCLYANAQTKKPDDEQRLKTVEAEIIQLEQEIKLVSADLSALLVKYTREYPAARKIQSELTTLEEKLFALNLEKKNLLQKEFARTLPNNDILLLKMIVIQNEKIIELLKKMVNR